jgi:hypothetical protein
MLGAPFEVLEIVVGRESEFLRNALAERGWHQQEYQNDKRLHSALLYST